MTAHTYPSPHAFKQALEQRLRTASAPRGQFTRKRQLLVFERFLARCTAVLGEAVVLKGGLVLELRLGRARTTKDVDLGWLGSPDDALGTLQEAARRDLGDFLAFEVSLDLDSPEIQNDGLRYEGRRFRVECRLAGKPYGHPFGVDVVIAAHEHNYERFAPQDFLGRFDSARGIRQFIVGTGGTTLRAVGPAKPNSEVHGSSWGVLVLTLEDSLYRWEFRPVEPGGFQDAGVGQCH